MPSSKNVKVQIEATDETQAPLMLAELSAVVAQMSALSARRDELVKKLMAATPKVAREQIAKAADLSVPRLYQVQGGRR